MQNDTSSGLSSVICECGGSIVEESARYICIRFLADKVLRELTRPIYFLIFRETVNLEQYFRHPDDLFRDVPTILRNTHALTLCVVERHLLRLNDELQKKMAARDYYFCRLSDLGPKKGVRFADLLRRSLLQILPTRLLNPYKIHVHTPLSMIFGRDANYEDLRTNSGHMFIYGARRIGKSSLVKSFADQAGSISQGMAMRGGNALHLDIRACSYVDVSGLGSGIQPRDFWERLIRGFGIQSAQEIFRTRRLVPRSRLEAREPTNDERWLLETLFTRYKGMLTVILDEVDGWLIEDAKDNWALLNQLRAITDNGNARVIMVGYEILSRAVASDKFPLRARGQARRLFGINRNDVDRLVSEPLAELDVRIGDRPAFIDRIWQISAGYPHIVQDICRGLVEIYFKKRDLARRSRSVTVELTINDLKAAIDESTAVRLMLRPTFVAEFPLAELVAAVTAGIGPPAFAPDGKGLHYRDIWQQLEMLAQTRAPQVTFTFDEIDLRLALSFLTLSGVLKAVDERETVYVWENAIAQREFRLMIEERGVDLWATNVLKRHMKEDWRKRYVIDKYL